MSMTVPGPGVWCITSNNNWEHVGWLRIWYGVRILKPTCANPVIIESGKDSHTRPFIAISGYKNWMMIMFIVPSTPLGTSSIAHCRFHSRMHHVDSSQTYRMLGIRYSKHNSGGHVFADPTSLLGWLNWSWCWAVWPCQFWFYTLRSNEAQEEHKLPRD
jgi:hypothetical protein